jgi:hypothetical protein
MTQEDKELSFKDLSARLPHHVRVKVWLKDGTTEEGLLDLEHNYGNVLQDAFYYNKIKDIKPYLRPMSSMTEEERIEFSKLLVKRYCEEDWEGHISTSYCIEIDNVYTDDENGIKYPSAFSMDAIDWLNAHHFDYRGLIEKGLALQAPEGMYN